MEYLDTRSTFSEHIRVGPGTERYREFRLKDYQKQYSYLPAEND